MAEFPLVLPSQENRQMTLTQEGPLFILHMHNRDNRFTTQFVQCIIRALQVIEDIFVESEDPKDMALLTIGDGKFYSNGLDLQCAITYQPFMDRYLYLLKKLLTFCIPTVAAINGHAFAGGCMFAFAHGNLGENPSRTKVLTPLFQKDYRLMRSDRGYICMNEVDIPSPLAPGMAAIIREKTTPQVYRDIVLQARRFTSKEAFEHGIVDFIYPENELLPKAKDFALKWAHKAKAGIVYKQLKEEMYADTTQKLGIPFNRLANRL